MSSFDFRTQALVLFNPFLFLLHHHVSLKLYLSHCSYCLQHQESCPNHSRDGKCLIRDMGWTFQTPVSLFARCLSQISSLTISLSNHFPYLTFPPSLIAMTDNKSSFYSSLAVSNIRNHISILKWRMSVEELPRHSTCFGSHKCISRCRDVNSAEWSSTSILSGLVDAHTWGCWQWWMPHNPFMTQISLIQTNNNVGSRLDITRILEKKKTFHEWMSKRKKKQI